MDEVHVQLERLLGHFRTESTQHLATQERVQVLNEQWAAASKVLHDVNNQLLVIHFACRQLLAQIPENDPVRSLVTAIDQARNEAAAATKTLRSPSASPRSDKSDLNQIIRDLETLLTPIIPDGVIFTVKLAAVPFIVPLEPIAAWKIVSLLVTNALFSVSQGGWLTIETFQHKSAKLGKHPTTSFCLKVSDTGPIEVDSEQIVTVPDETPFDSPSLVSQLARELAESPATIHLVERSNEGSQLTISFPSPTQAVANEHLPGPHFRLKKPQTVLLVDDEPQIRRMLRSLLESHGYRVLEAANGPDAIAIGLDPAEHIHLLLTDYYLPGASGMEIANRLKSRYASLPILMMSGSGDLGDSLDGSDLTCDILTKPFPPNELLRHIHALLRSAISVSET